MFYLLNDLLLCFFEVICCGIFIEVFAPPERKRTRWRAVRFFGTTTLLQYGVAVCLSEFLLLRQATVIGLLAFSMHLYYRIRLKRTMLLAAIYQGLAWVADLLVYVGLYSDAIASQMEVNEMMGRMFVVIGKAVLLLIVIILRNISAKRTRSMSDAKWFRLLIFPLYTIAVGCAITMNFESIGNVIQMTVLYWIVLGLVGMNVVIFYVMNDIVKRNAQLSEAKILEIQVKEQTQKYRYISENYEKQKAKAHEFKNQIQCIEALLKNEEYQALEQYVGKIGAGIAAENNIINTNHPIINAVLNTKYAEAVQKGIVFIVRVNDLSVITVSEEDMVILLSNLLNNAIEAGEKCSGQRSIKVKLLKETDKLILSVKNSKDHDTRRVGDAFETTKEQEPGEHGFGIGNIIKIVEKYQGIYVISDENQEFCFSIIIPL